MVKLHSVASAKGLIAVMGDTPELVETGSELDFVEVSFGPMCRNLLQCVNCFETSNLDSAPLCQC